ncbi:MAG: class I SAM-dependent methyltransferase [Candidatus Omnitrophica bacterium]|nr:class I SAM-dependent methyltransferase [Candidatus Omnitrophota bacterium]
MLEFDFWQRCETVRQLLNWAMPDPGRILDVGGYPGRLRSIIPQHEWVICDPRVDAPGEQVQGDAAHLPFRDESFDFAASLDVLEHIAQEDRESVLEEMLRVSRQGLILTFPAGHPLTASAEDKVCQVYKQLHGKEHPWLAEHARQPLPDADEIVQFLLSHGGQAAVFDVGETARWVYLQCLDILLEALPESLDFAEEIDRLYQENLYIHDFKAPAYRKVILYMMHEENPISLSMIETSPDEQAADLLEFHQKTASGLLDLIQKKTPPSPAAASEPEREKEAPEEESQTKESKEELGEPSVWEKMNPREADEYIARLEAGVQAWEKTYKIALDEVADMYRWRDRLEQRRSFRLYKRIMRLLGARIEP